MEVRIQAINFDASEKLMAFINKKADRLNRPNVALTGLDVKMTVAKPESAMNKDVVMKAIVPQGEMVANKRADSFEEAIYHCLEAIERQLEKYKKM